MKIKLILVGKTESSFVESGYDIYKKRIKRFIQFEEVIIKLSKKHKALPKERQKEIEGELILSSTSNSDILVLLDERGKEFTSKKFAQYIQQKMNTGKKNLVFIVGGPYGFSEDVYNKVKEQVAISKMTFTHDMIRLLFIEQIYRSFTILNNDPYHH